MSKLVKLVSSCITAAMLSGCVISDFARRETRYEKVERQEGIEFFSQERIAHADYLRLTKNNDDLQEIEPTESGIMSLKDRVTPNLCTIAIYKTGKTKSGKIDIKSLRLCSGIFITKDGFLLGPAHAFKDDYSGISTLHFTRNKDTNKLEPILSNAVQIRSSPADDISLLKIDKKLTDFYQISIRQERLVRGERIIGINLEYQPLGATNQYFSNYQNAKSSTWPNISPFQFSVSNGLVRTLASFEKCTPSFCVWTDNLDNPRRKNVRTEYGIIERVIPVLGKSEHGNSGAPGLDEKGRLAVMGVAASEKNNLIYVVDNLSINKFLKD